MIIDFSIQNFGSIRDKQTLSFEADKSTHLEEYYTYNILEGLKLLKLGLIYGANASGKTTILHALDFLRELAINPAERKTEEFDFKPFLFDSETPKQNTIFSINFVQNSLKYNYEIELNERYIVKEELYFYNPNKANVFRRKTDPANQFTEINLGGKIKKDKTFEKTLASNTLWNNTVLGGFLKTNIDQKELKDATDWFSDYLKPLVETDARLNRYVARKIENAEFNKNILIDILRKADFNISDIIVNKNVAIADDSVIKVLRAMDLPEGQIDKMKETTIFDINFEHSIDNKSFSLPLEAESLGTQRYFGLAGLLSTLLNNSVAIPIDELESSLHPDLFMHFLLSFLVNAKKSQLIATTHNREILDNKDIFRNDAIWFTDKTEYCATELYSLADFDSSVVRDTSNIYNAYKHGKLGAIPNLGDYYIGSVHES